MAHKTLSLFLLNLLLVLNASLLFSQNTDKIMIIIIDGARYTETFGDPDHTYIPNMYSISQGGTVINNFYNDGTTYTSRAIPALWCGTWTEVRDTIYNGNPTKYAVKPTLFEYYRKQKSMPSSECYYILKYIESLWLPSFDPDYGPDYWPQFHSAGQNDNDVANHVQFVMDNIHPHFMWVYLADVDHAGHSGNWVEYTHAIKNADSIVGVLWNKIQSDPFYANSTNLFVTNDHGRHDDQHGGFSGHGCSCEGCRHIQLLALGPDIKPGFISTTSRQIPDLAVTASHILGIDPEDATGEVMMEILDQTSIYSNELNSVVSDPIIYPNPFKEDTRISFHLKANSSVTLKIFDINGKEIKSLLNSNLSIGKMEINWNGTYNNGQFVEPGTYFYLLEVNNIKLNGKLIKISNIQ